MGVWGMWWWSTGLAWWVTLAFVVAGYIAKGWRGAVVGLTLGVVMVGVSLLAGPIGAQLLGGE